VDIVEDVPDYLFASATYATPIKFQVTGMGSKVNIDGLKARLYLDGDLAKGNIPIGTRFVNGSGTTQNNGDTDTYTGYINHTQYNSISLGDTHRTDDAKFVLEVTSSPDDPAIDMPYVICRSKKTDSQAAMDVFCDDYIFAVELGITGVGDGRKRYLEEHICSQTNVQAVHRRSNGSYEHCERGDTGLYGLNGYCDPANGYTYPHEAPEELEPYPGRIGMWGLCGREFDVYEYYNPPFCDPPHGMSAYTHLKDDNDLFKAPTETNVNNAGVKSRIYGKRYGVYFFVSYGGKELDSGILNSGEYAMDLTKDHADYDWTLFDNGKAQITNEQESSGGLGIGTIAASAFAVASALSTSTAWAVVFIAAGETFQIVDDLDSNSGGESNAQGAVYIIKARNYPGGGSSEHKWDSIEKSTSGQLPWTTLSTGDTGVSCDSGDQWSYWVEIESVSYVKTALTDCVESSCRTEFKASSSDDWLFWDLVVGPGS